MAWAKAAILLLLLSAMLSPIAGRAQDSGTTVEWVVSDGGGVEAGGNVTVTGLPDTIAFGTSYTVTFSFVVRWFDWGSNIRPQTIEWYAKAGCLEETFGICVRNSQNITLGSSTVPGSFASNQTFSVTASLSLKDRLSTVNGTSATLGVRIGALIECLDSSVCSPVGGVNPAQRFSFLRPESSVSFNIFSPISQNVIRNPSFEEGVNPTTGYPAGWGNWTKHGGSNYSITVDNTTAVDQLHSARLEIGNLFIGFIALTQDLLPNTYFSNLTDRADDLDAWFKLQPKYSGMGDVRFRILYGENVAELNYVIDADPLLYYPNSTFTFEDGRNGGVKSILISNSTLERQGDWFHFKRNLRADWAAPLILPGGSTARGFSLSIPFPRIQFDILSFRNTNTNQYFAETAWVDDVKVYESIGPPEPTPDFAISASPDSLKIPPGSSSTSTVTVTSVNGFSGLVHLTANVLSGYLPDPGITASLGQPVLLLTPGRSNSTILSVLVSNSTLPDTFSILVSGNAGHSAVVLADISGTSQLLQRGPWSLEWQLSDNDGVIIRNISYSGLSIVKDARLPGILSTYLNDQCGPFYEEAVGARIDPSQILVEDLATGGFQIRAPYYEPGEIFEQIWRFQPDGSFQGLVVIGNGGCSPAHAYEARWRYAFSLATANTILSYDGTAWRKVEQEGVFSDSGLRDNSHNSTVWAVTGGGSSVFMAPSDSMAPDAPGSILAVVDRAGEIETNHSSTETPSAVLNNETLAGANAAIWYVSKHSVDSLDVRPSNLAITTGLAFYVRTPSDLPPVASFTVSPNCADATTTFDATSSFDPDGTIVSYHWSFGDGFSATVTAPVTNHTYSAFGTYTVTLTVTDSGIPALNASQSHALVISNCIPFVTFSFTSSPTAGQPVTFTATVFGGVPPYSFSWAFGDGAVDTGNPIVHIYASGGLFPVTLTVTDSNGLQISATQSVRVEPSGNISPVADFTFTPASQRAGQVVLFDGSGSYDPDGNVTNWAWNFGDVFCIPGPCPGESTGPFVQHVFQSQGNYTVMLTVTDNLGGYNRVFKSIQILPPLTHDIVLGDIRVQPQVAVQGQPVGILLLVRNAGSTRSETVTIIVYFDSQTAVARNVTIFNNDPFGFVFLSWDTSNVPPGNYTISARAYLAADENPDNNFLSDGTVTILQPPTLALEPSSGMLGSKVDVQASGFPRPEYGPATTVLVTFDDMFLGVATARNGSFTFTFDVPHAEPGPHQVKAFDPSTNVRAVALFQVLPEPGPIGTLGVSVDVGSLYFPGDSADVYILTVVNGSQASSANLRLDVVVVKPDGTTVSLSTTQVVPGLFKASFLVPSTGALGTYAVTATAHLGDLDASALSNFEVKQTWLAAQGPRIASVGAIAGVFAVLIVAWRKGFVRRPRDDFLA